MEIEFMQFLNEENFQNKKILYTHLYIRYVYIRIREYKYSVAAAIKLCSRDIRLLKDS